MAEVLELPRGTQRQLSPHFAKNVRNKFHGGGFSATSASDVQESSVLLWGDWLFFTGKDLHKATYQEPGLDYLAHVPAPVLRNFKAKSRVRTRRKR